MLYVYYRGSAGQSPVIQENQTFPQAKVGQGFITPGGICEILSIMWFGENQHILLEPPASEPQAM